VEVEFKGSFYRDLRRIKSQALKQRIKKAIKEVEQASTLRDVANLGKIKGKKSSYYRIRIGDYRIGLRLRDKTVIFVRFLHRKDIYKYFP
jgi:mRNA interferase RelE/StbE